MLPFKDAQRQSPLVVPLDSTPFVDTSKMTCAHRFHTVHPVHPVHHPSKPTWIGRPNKCFIYISPKAVAWLAVPNWLPTAVQSPVHSSKIDPSLGTCCRWCSPRTSLGSIAQYPRGAHPLGVRRADDAIVRLMKHDMHRKGSRQAIFPIQTEGGPILCESFGVQSLEINGRRHNHN